MYHEFAAVLIFIIAGTAFVAAGLLFGALLRLRKPGPGKTAIYECGEPTIGSSWIRYNSRFYNVALVYLLFDVEVILLIPIFVVFREKAAHGAAAGALAAVLVFLFLLCLGLAYEWWYGNLDWIRRLDRAVPSNQGPSNQGPSDVGPSNILPPDEKLDGE